MPRTRSPQSIAGNNGLQNEHCARSNHQVKLFILIVNHPDIVNVFNEAISVSRCIHSVDDVHQFALGTGRNRLDFYLHAGNLSTKSSDQENFDLFYDIPYPFFPCFDTIVQMKFRKQHAHYKTPTSFLHHILSLRR